MHTPILMITLALGLNTEPPATPALTTAQTPTPAAAPVSAPSLTITVSTEQAPDLAEWGDKAKTICTEWWPKILAELPSDG